jgi:hypothetical protein
MQNNPRSGINVSDVGIYNLQLNCYSNVIVVKLNILKI